MSVKPYILIVDDEADIREPIGTYLTMNGFEVALAANSQEAHNHVADREPDLAILDIILGNENGMDLCKALQKTADIAVIFLSGESADTERIIGLEVGADDYIVKPFNPRELLARVKAVLRRTQKSPSKDLMSARKISFGPWVLDPAQHEISNTDGQTTSLSSGETALLLAFLEQPGRILSRDQLMDILHGRHMEVFDRSIDNYIARLRKKVEQDAGAPKLIKTHWGKGYAISSDCKIIN